MVMNNVLKKITMLVMGISTAGCSWFSFSSNVDPRNFREYYKSSLITQYTKEEAVNLPPYDDLGIVEGMDCQISEEYATPKEGVARKLMLENAADSGANAVIIGKCIKVENTLSCISEYTCYAQAIRIHDDKSESEHH